MTRGVRGRLLFLLLARRFVVVERSHLLGTSRARRDLSEHLLDSLGHVRSIPGAVVKVVVPLKPWRMGVSLSLIAVLGVGVHYSSHFIPRQVYLPESVCSSMRLYFLLPLILRCNLSV